MRLRARGRTTKQAYGVAEEVGAAVGDPDGIADGDALGFAEFDGSGLGGEVVGAGVAPTKPPPLPLPLHAANAAAAANARNTRGFFVTGTSNLTDDPVPVPD